MRRGLNTHTHFQIWVRGWGVVQKPYKKERIKSHFSGWLWSLDRHHLPNLGVRGWYKTPIRKRGKMYQRERGESPLLGNVLAFRYIIPHSESHPLPPSWGERGEYDFSILTR